MVRIFRLTKVLTKARKVLTIKKCCDQTFHGILTTGCRFPYHQFVPTTQQGLGSRWDIQARGPTMETETFLWTRIINPITTPAEYRQMQALVLKARVDFELPASALPESLLQALYTWNSQRMMMKHHPSLGAGKYAKGWEANPVCPGVLVVSKHVGGRLVWKSEPYPAAVVREVFSQVDQPDSVFDTEEMAMLLWLFDRANQTA